MQSMRMTDVPRLTRLVNAYAHRQSRRDAMPEERLANHAFGAGTRHRYARAVGSRSERPRARRRLHTSPRYACSGSGFGFAGNAHQWLGIVRYLQGWILKRSQAALGTTPADLQGPHFSSHNG